MKKLVDAYRCLCMQLFGAQMRFYDKLMKLGLIDLSTNFKLTGKAFIKLMRVYVKRLEVGTMQVSKEVVEKVEELNALLDK